MRSILSLTGACAAGALVFATAGFAGQPVTQTLNPPPPSYEICKAVGDGTICQGTTTFSEGPIDTADEGLPLACGSGAGAFHAYDSFVDNRLARRIYDGNGDLVKRYRYDTSDGRYSNPLTGASVPYKSTLTNVDNLRVPGDLGSAIEQTTGEFIVRPASGGSRVHAGGQDGHHLRAGLLARLPGRAERLLRLRLRRHIRTRPALRRPRRLR